MKSIKLLAIAAIATLTFSACSEDDKPEAVNEEEVITTVSVTLTNSEDNTNVVILKSFDADGEGPLAAVKTVSGSLKAGKTYSGSIALLNETESPAEIITEEVEEEGLDHQFFYTSNLGEFSYDAASVDSEGNPIGIDFKMTTAATAKSGNITFTLRHEPNKSGANVKAGDITNAGGETDVEVVFELSTEE